VNVRYARPARYDDLLTIEVSCADEIPGPRIRIDYNVFRADTPKALVTGHVTLCFVDERSGRPMAAPPIFQEALARLASSDPLG
jgi:acyl-CoA thioester hydrolase